MHTTIVSRIRYAVVMPLVVGLTLGGCMNRHNQTDASLYEQLGGATGIAEVVDGMLVHIAEDPRINYTFAATNIARLRGLLEEQFCEVSGGPCEYSGFSMTESHRGMGITDTEFNAVVESLVDAMEAQQVPVALQNRLLARLAPMHEDIVYR